MPEPPRLSDPVGSLGDQALSPDPSGQASAPQAIPLHAIAVSSTIINTKPTIKPVVAKFS